jgi:hypothetical protein
MIDLDDSCAVLDAAKAFDKSYIEGRNVVMLAGHEIVNFSRHLAEDQGSRKSPGRRASDHVKADRIAELELEIARLQAANEMLTALREKDRRKQQLPFAHAEFRRT